MLSRILNIIAVFSVLAMPIGLGSGRVQAEGLTVVINELLWMGSSASSADEWIELRNTTDQSIDLSNWQLTKKSSGAEVAMLTIPAGKTVAAGGLFVIANYANTNANSTLNVVPDYVTTDVALSNSALQIKLYDSAHALIDTADDGVGNPLSGAYDSAKKLYASMERNPVPGDGTQASNWHAASRSLGFKPPAVELGTPGSVNSNALPTAAAGPDQTGTVGQAVNFDGSDSSDPENQPLTYHWDFGDGGTSAEVTPQRVYPAARTFTVTLTVSDGSDSTSDTATVTIENALAAPAAAPVTTPPVTIPDPVKPPAAAQNASCRGLRISEIYPNPPGVDNDEFIELQNGGDEEVDAGQCAVVTSVTKKYALPSATVPVNGFVLLPKSQTKLTLRNTGGMVRLLDVDGTELDHLTYEAAKEGLSYAMVNGQWQWTSQPTPQSANAFVEATIAVPKADTKTAVTAKKTTKKTAKTSATTKPLPPAQRVTLAQVQELDSGDRVIIRGQITAAVGALGATVTFLQDKNAGVSVTIPNGEPAVKPGSQAEITGTVRLKQGRRYVAAAAYGLKVLSAASAPKPADAATDEVGPDQADQLVKIKGVVALVSGNRIEIDDGSGPAPIYLKSSTGIIRPKVKAGDTVEAVGIVSVSTSGIRVLPRNQDDLRVERVLGAATTAVQTTTVPTSSPRQTLWYWVFAALGGLGAGAKPAWVAWRKGHGRPHEPR